MSICIKLFAATLEGSVICGTFVDMRAIQTVSCKLEKLKSDNAIYVKNFRSSVNYNTDRKQLYIFSSDPTVSP